MESSKLSKAQGSAEPKEDHFMTILLVIALVAFVAFMALGNWKQGNEIRHVYDVQVQGRGCVVAAIENKQPSTYRCDSPVSGQYVKADALWAEARAIVAARYEKR